MTADIVVKEMPLNAVGWSTEDDDEKLAELVQPHSYLYNVLDPSRKNILARESTWQEIAQALNKPVEECKKRWRCLRDSYMRTKRMGSMHKAKTGVFEKLQFLDGTSLDGTEDEESTDAKEDSNISISLLKTEQQVITDNQEYYEITVVDDPQEQQDTLAPKVIKIQTKQDNVESLEKKIRKSNAGRKRSLPIPQTNAAPIKILPKPLVMNGPKLIRYVEDPKSSQERSQVVDKLIEKVLKENTNEIDVFFRSMAASVKKLQPNLIPKVKMEVCNVIAKYEMQSIERGGQ